MRTFTEDCITNSSRTIFTNSGGLSTFALLPQLSTQRVISSRPDKSA
jgi:hypothetical protein